MDDREVIHLSVLYSLCWGLHRTEGGKDAPEVQALRRSEPSDSRTPLQWKHYQVCQLQRPARSGQPVVPNDGASRPERPSKTKACTEGVPPDFPREIETWPGHVSYVLYTFLFSFLRLKA